MASKIHCKKNFESLSITDGSRGSHNTGNKGSNVSQQLNVHIKEYIKLLLKQGPVQMKMNLCNGTSFYQSCPGQ